ncbi:hypothetical protein [Peribacillus sp. NPDC097295]|uniref:hypothetical protein n=1 Tax=Peribacillus sp. NPDC097295 TaxID=3364402 RepID=UPI003807DEEC
MMKIKEVMEHLSVKGNTIAKIAKDKVGLGEKKLKNALHSAGYEYKNQAPKGWYYAGEGDEPLYQSVFDFIEPKNVSIIRPFYVNESSPMNSQKDELDVKSVRNECERSVHTDFTPEESAILKELIKAFILDEKKKEDMVGNRDFLYQRIISLGKGEKVRKTIVINEEVGALLDKFADQQMLKKSDLMEIAIVDLVNKYK